jgi:hypothetical protein
MKTFARILTISILSAVGLGLTSSDLHAGATVPGNVCEWVSGAATPWATTAIQVNGVSVVTCPIPIDHQLGTTVTFRMGVTESSSVPTDRIVCNGYVYSENGSQLGMVTPNITSAACDAQGGGCKITAQQSTTVNPQSATNVYVMKCQTPLGTLPYSALETVRVF